MLILSTVAGALAVVTALWFAVTLLLLAAQADARRRLHAPPAWLSAMSGASGAAPRQDLAVVSHPYEETQVLRRAVARRTTWRALPA